MVKPTPQQSPGIPAIVPVKLFFWEKQNSWIIEPARPHQTGCDASLTCMIAGIKTFVSGSIAGATLRIWRWSYSLPLWKISRAYFQIKGIELDSLTGINRHGVTPNQ